MLPAGATSPAKLHASLLSRRSGIADLRDLDVHWESDFYSASLVPDRSTSALAGVVNDIDLKAPQNVPVAIFEGLSRAQRLLCIAISPCIKLLQNANRVMCIVGATADGFEDQDKIAALRYTEIDVDLHEIRERLQLKPSAYSSPYNAIRQVFDAVVKPGLDISLIDAACASSLYAVTLGMSALENNQTDLVLAGGIYCPGPGNNCLFSQFGGLTSTGCRPFDAHADGVAFAEGAAFVVLQRLADAQRAGYRPFAILRGAGLSSDGRSPSANVPQTSGQLIAVQRCYENYGLDPKSIHAIEGHGTSTPAGDATEIKTLATYFAKHGGEPKPIHSLKGLLGHTGWAAGTASMICAIESLRTKQFPGQANFSNASPALRQAANVLRVSNETTTLGSPISRIAIDGFGFGGANAHLVVETHNEETHSLNTVSATVTDTSELVVVAYHSESPTAPCCGLCQEGNQHLMFNRTLRYIPEDIVILPDLLEDMDLSQRLAIKLASEVIGQLGDDAEKVREQTSVIVAYEGKTERANEATLRVLYERLRRELSGLPCTQTIMNAYERARPAGPYTLQCMMPNVAAGRAALHLNLKGPNFVVDAGEDSLDRAIRSAEQLLRHGLRSGTKLAIVASIKLCGYTKASDCPKEHAFAAAITTKRLAEENGWKVVAAVDEFASFSPDSDDAQTDEQRPRQVSKPKQVASQAPAATPLDMFPLYTPVWVESKTALKVSNHNTRERILLVVDASETVIRDVFHKLGESSSQYNVLLVGDDASRLAYDLRHENIFAWNPNETNELESWVDSLQPTLLLALLEVRSGSSVQMMERLIKNGLCEATFVAMKQLVDSIEAGRTAVWGLVLNGWHNKVHPESGPLSGLLKATRREMPGGRFGLVHTATNSVQEAFDRLRDERFTVQKDEPETVYVGKQRRVRRLRKITRELTQGDENRYRLDENSVVLATGGGRGVTAVMVESLLTQFGCSVVSVGRSALHEGPTELEMEGAEAGFYAKYLQSDPQARPKDMRQAFERQQASWEAHAMLRRFSNLPGKYIYIQANVLDDLEMARVMEGVRKQFGRLDLIVHGAGIQYSKKLRARTLDEFRSTYEIKVRGLRNLADASQRQFEAPVPIHVLTSAYSIFGNDGQHDYGAANEAMDRICDWHSNDNWTSMAWSAWDRIGMTRGSEYEALANQRNLALINAEEGKRIFEQMLYERSRSSIYAPISSNEIVTYQLKTLPSVAQPNDQQTSEVELLNIRFPHSEEHLVRGLPTVAGVTVVDLMLRNIRKSSRPAHSYATIENVVFKRFLRANHFPTTLRCISDQYADHESVSILGSIYSSQGVELQRDVMFAALDVRAETAFIKHSKLKWIEQTLSMEKAANWQDPYCRRNGTVALQGVFDCILDIHIGEAGRTASVSIPAACAFGDSYPSLVLDAALRVGGMHLINDFLHVPTTVERITVPTHLSTDSLAGHQWKVIALPPKLVNDEIYCERIEVFDERDDLQMLITGAYLTKIV